MGEQNKKTQRWLGAMIVLILLVGGAAAKRWMPRAKPVPAPEMTNAAAIAMSASSSITAEPTFTPSANPSTDRERLIAAGVEMLGVPYRFGAKGPDEIDCSGFTKEAYAVVGIRLPDGSYNQARGERPLPADLDELMPGDLLFYRWPSKDAVSHVTMYAGSGWVIGTGSPGQPPHVVVYPLAEDLRDDGRVITFRHIILPDEK